MRKSSEEHEKVEPNVALLTTGLCDLAFRCCDRGEVSYYLGPFYTAQNCSTRLMTQTELAAAAPFAIGPVPERR